MSSSYFKVTLSRESQYVVARAEYPSGITIRMVSEWSDIRRAGVDSWVRRFLSHTERCPSGIFAGAIYCLLPRFARWCFFRSNRCTRVTQDAQRPAPDELILGFEKAFRRG